MLKTAIIGVSGYGNVHFTNLLRGQQSGRVEISAATIINQEEEAEKSKILSDLGCKIYCDYQKMLADFAGKLDLGCIPTGISQHAPMANAAMLAGANALIEKPAAATLQQVDSMQKMEIQSGKRVFVGFQHIYQDITLKAKEYLVAGKLGRLLEAKGICLWARTKDYYSRNSWAGRLRWNGEWVLDSPFNNATAHFLNLLLFLAGENFEESAQLKHCNSELYRANKIEGPDSAALQFETSIGVKVGYYCSHAVSESMGPVLELICERGTLRITPEKISVIDSKNKELLLGKWNEGGKLAAKIFDSVWNRLENKNDFVCGLEIARQHTTAVNAVHDSTRVVQIPENFNDTWFYQDTQPVIFTKNMHEVLYQCFLKNKMPSDINHDWGKSGSSLNLNGYIKFEGKTIQ